MCGNWGGDGNNSVGWGGDGTREGTDGDGDRTCGVGWDVDDFRPRAGLRGRNVRRNLVRGSMPPCRLRREENFENLTTKWCVLKYIGINMWSA